MKYRSTIAGIGAVHVESIYNYHTEKQENIFNRVIQKLHLHKSFISKIFAIIIILITSLINIDAQTLIAYYPLNGNAKDSGSHHFNGVISGGVTSTTDRNENADHAFSFDGQTGRIDVPDAPALRPSKFTLSAWFYISKVPNGVKHIVTKNLCNSYHESYSLYLEPGSGILRGDVSNGNINLTATGPAPALNVWHLATMSFDENTDTLRLYLDGALVNAVATSLKIAYDANSFAIGYELENCSNNYFFDGKIDDVSLYDDVLSDNQVLNLFDSAAPVHKPGSGTDLHFNGKNSYAVIPASVLANAKKFTIEYWINTTENRSNNTFWQRPTMIGNETANAPSQDFGITSDNGRVGMWSGLNSGGDNWLLTNTNINDGKWHHIAAVNNGVKIILYVDGILQDGNLSSGRSLLTSTKSLYIGASNTNYTNGAAFYHEGKYDEVRFWSKPLTRQEIRDRMCHKISPSDSLYSYLVAYYNFDEDQANIALDVANQNTALLANNPQRWNSDAPIGDTSVNIYSSEPKSLSIAAASGETFEISSVSGQSKGLHLYVVNESPLNKDGIDTLCAKNKYFGIFSVAEAYPTYSGIYNYSANECVTTTNENELRIYQKRHTDSTVWYQLSYLPDIAANTITISDIHRYNARFILGIDNLSNTISSKADLIKNTATITNITLSPNPASSLLHVHFNSAIKENSPITIRIVDQNYKEVWKNLNLQNDIAIDVHTLAQGLYFIHFVSVQGIVTKKFIVSR